MTALLIRLVVLVAIFASVFLFSQVVVGALLNRSAERSAVNRRLTMLRSGVDHRVVTDSLLKNAPPHLQPDAGLLMRLRVAFIRSVMMTAWPITARQLAFGMAVAFGIVAFVILFLVWASSFALTPGVVLLAMVIAFAVAVGLPLMAISRRAQKRRKRMQEQFPLALDVFTRSLRAGHPIASAISLVTEEMEDPIGSEFGLVADEVAYGADLNDALQGMADRWALDDMKMFVVCVSVQSETGGNLAEILENLSTVIRDRASMYLKVRALSSEGRMSGWMLTALPVLTFLSMLALNPGFYFEVAQDPIFVGGFTTLLVMYALGVFGIRKIIDLKV
jgi:tight adherence protein B